MTLMGDLPVPRYGSVIMSMWESVVDAEVGDVDLRPGIGWIFVDTIGGIILGVSFSAGPGNTGVIDRSGEGGGRENS
jgi:hypothetical protein